MLYLSFFLILFALSYSDVLSRNKLNRKFLFIYLFIPIVLIAGLRYNIGYDWITYLNNFQKSTLPLDKQTLEIGFIYLNRFFKELGSNYFFLQIFIAFFTAICVYKFISKYAEFPIISILGYYTGFYLSYNMGLTRQCLALSITLISFDYLVKKEVFKYLLCIIISALFHKTAIIFLIAFLLPQKYSKIFSCILIVIAIFIDLRSETFVRFFMEYFTQTYGIYTSYIYSRFQAKAATGYIFYSRILAALILLILYTPRTKFDLLAWYLFLLSLIFEGIGRQFDILLRLKTYFAVYDILVIPKFIKVISFRKLSSMKYIYIGIILLYLSIEFITFIYTSRHAGFQLYNPYQIYLFHYHD